MISVQWLELSNWRKEGSNLVKFAHNFCLNGEGTEGENLGIFKISPHQIYSFVSLYSYFRGDEESLLRHKTEDIRPQLDIFLFPFPIIDI